MISNSEEKKNLFIFAETEIKTGAAITRLINQILSHLQYPLTLLFVLVFISCNKEEDNELLGRWVCTQFEPARDWIFTGDLEGELTYEFFQNGTFTSGSAESHNYRNLDDGRILLAFDNGREYEMDIFLSKNILVLDDSDNTGWRMEFARESSEELRQANAARLDRDEIANKLATEEESRKERESKAKAAAESEYEMAMEKWTQESKTRMTNIIKEAKRSGSKFKASRYEYDEAHRLISKMQTEEDPQSLSKAYQEFNDLLDAFIFDGLKEREHLFFASLEYLDEVVALSKQLKNNSYREYFIVEEIKKGHKVLGNEIEARMLYLCFYFMDAKTENKVLELFCKQTINTFLSILYFQDNNLYTYVSGSRFYDSELIKDSIFPAWRKIEKPAYKGQVYIELESAPPQPSDITGY